MKKKALNKLKEKLEKPKEDVFARDDIVESLKDEFKGEDEKIPQKDDIFTDAIENILEEETIKAKKDIDSQEDYLENEIVGDNYSVSNEDLTDNSSDGKIIEKIIPPSGESASSENIAKEDAPAEPQIDNAIKSDEHTQQSNEPKKPAKKSSRFGIILFAILIIIALIIGIIFFL